MKNELLKLIEKDVDFHKDTVTIPKSTWELIVVILGKLKIEIKND